MKKVLVVGVITISFLLLLIPSVSATWCDANYGKKAPILINNTGGAAQTHYQVELNYTYDSDMNANFSDIRVYNESDCSLIPLWNESAVASSWNQIWFNATGIPASSWTNDTYYLYYDYSSASTVSNITSTFLFGDDFTGTTINETYLTSWTKSGSNPLQDKTCQNWVIAVYSNYNSEDKIYIFEQRNASPSSNIEAWSFTRANASTPANWTDHGVVFTGVGAHDDGHIEPHGIIFETQSMADAREGVGVGEGTRKWRLYYCAKGDGEAVSKYSANFAYASESDLTSWTAYASNPIYDHDAEWGFADSKVCIYNDKVWLHHCRYKTGTSCDSPFFTVSDNGIDNWTDKSLSWAGGTNTIMGTLVSFSNGILVTGRPSQSDWSENQQSFTNDGNARATYSGNPVLSGGGGGSWDEKLYWSTIVVDKDGSPNISGADTYYMYYIGHNVTVDKLGLATSTTLTEETEEVYTLTDKWDISGSPSVSSGELLLNADGEYIKSINTFQYKALKTKAKFAPLSADNSYQYFGFQSSAGAGTANTEMFFTYDTPDLKVWSCDADGSEATSIYDAAYFDSYHNYEILWKSGEAKFIVDDVLKDTDTTEVCTVAEPVGFFDYTTAADLYVDWILVRNYASPEPTASLGTEESPSATYTPPNPTNLQNTTGNFWVNYTWDAGSGNVTNSYNVSNETAWINGSSNTYFNESLEASEWLNITVYAYNSSGGGTLSAGSVSDQQQAPSVSTKKFYETSTSDFSAEVAVIDLYTSRDGTANNVAYELATGNLYNYINATSNITVGNDIKIPAGTKVNFSAYFDDGDRVDYAYATWKFYRLVGTSTTLVCQKGDDSTGGVQIPDGTTETITGYCSVTSDVTLNSTDKVRLIMNVWAETIGGGGAATKVATHYWDSTHESWVEYKYQLTTTDTTFTVSLPVGYTKPVFEPPNSTATNYPPNGQTSSQEFFNVTNSGNVNLDVRMRLNTTVSTITLKADADNNPTGADTIGTSLVTIHSNLGQGSSADIWLWSDFDHTPAQTANRTIYINVSQS